MGREQKLELPPATRAAMRANWNQRKAIKPLEGRWVWFSKLNPVDKGQTYTKPTTVNDNP